MEQWDDYSGEVEALEDHGDQVLAVVSERATGAGSGAPVESTLFAVCDFRAGKVCRYREYYDETAAPAALAEETQA
jgi:ketosteroid isomerase-like protein